MNKSLATLAIAVSLPVLLNVACRQPTTASNKMDGSVHGDRIIADDPKFFDQIEIMEKVATRAGDGFLKVQVRIRNTGRMSQDFETVFEWFDEKGIKVESVVEHWKPGSIYGMEHKEIIALAPTRQVVSFRFHLRRSNPLVFDNR